MAKFKVWDKVRFVDCGNKKYTWTQKKYHSVLDLSLARNNLKLGEVYTINKTLLLSNRLYSIDIQNIRVNPKQFELVAEEAKVTGFEVWDIVRLSEEWKNKFTNSHSNPHDISWKIGGSWYNIITVIWDNKYQNYYVKEDLELVENILPKETEVETIQSWDWQSFIDWEEVFCFEFSYRDYFIWKVNIQEKEVKGDAIYKEYLIWRKNNEMSLSAENRTFVKISSWNVFIFKDDKETVDNLLPNVKHLPWKFVLKWYKTNDFNNKYFLFSDWETRFSIGDKHLQQLSSINWETLELNKERIEEKIEENNIIQNNNKTKADLIKELAEANNRINNSIIKFKEQEKEKKDLQERVSSLELKVGTVENKLEKEKKEKQKILKEIEDNKKKTLSPKAIKWEKIRLNKVWDNIIIEDNIYQTLQFAYKQNLPLLLRWLSGTGKSSIIKALATEHWNQIIQFNFNWDTTVEHLLGHKVLIGWDMSFEDWPLTRAVRNWGVFLGDELNASNPEIQFILNWLLENKNWELWSLSVQGNNWEVIKPHKDFRFFGTYNPWYLGTKSFSTSLLSRFIWVEIKPLLPDKEFNLLQSKYPKVDKIIIERLIELETQLRNDSNFVYDVSTRDLVQALLFVDWGFWIVEAIKTTILSALQLDTEQKLLIEKCKNIFPEVAKDFIL